MFATLLDDAVAMTDAELDDAIRQSELAARAHAARQAVLLAVAARRGAYREQGHRTMQAYLRATVNVSNASIARQRRLATLLESFPCVGEALLAGRISVDHALEIASVQSNRRIAHLLGLVIEVFVDDAEHSSLGEFAGLIAQFVNAADQDGAFRDVADNVAHRSARVTSVDGCLDVVATGGDPITAEQLAGVFASFVEGEYRHDLEARRAEFGDDADGRPLRRTPGQRNFDALVAIFAAAAGAPDGRALPEPTVLIGIDHRSIDDAFTRAGIVLASGNQVDLSELVDDDSTLLDTLADELRHDPAGFRSRHCETSSGSAIPAVVALQAALLGHIRRVVVDSRGVVVDLGVKQRVFSPSARVAAQWLTSTCTFPGCTLPARLCQVDHNDEWYQGGRTDQANANIVCGPHNRYKHRQRLRTRRDRRGRTYHLRPDGTVLLPVGERPPDLSIDEMARLIHARVLALGPPAPLSD